MTLRHLALLTGLLMACGGGTLGGEDGGADARRGDTGLGDSAVDAQFDTGEDGGGDAGEGLGEPRTEVCGNGVDDDADGRIDNGCDCTVGTVRACWLGPVGADEVGECSAGQQACEPEGEVGVWGLCVDQDLPSTEISATGLDEDCDGLVDESDARCVSTVQIEAACDDGVDDDCNGLIDCEDPACRDDDVCTMSCTPTEAVCWGGADEDCDGSIDCDDDDCRDDDACATPVCPNGQGPIYTERSTFPPIAGPPQLEPGDGEPVMPMTCGNTPCSNGQVQVTLRDGGFVCAPPPPTCAENQYPTYQTGGRWRCEPPCEFIARYGYLYGFKRVCAGPPDIVCGGSQVPTFLANEQVWSCEPICDNTLYDRIFHNGLLVCLPC
ncbi:MAG: hypothetical protein AB8H86_06635 [Polyangiales bacterium]